MPKGNSGINRGGGAGKYDSEIRQRLQSGNYQKSETFQSTTRYKVEAVNDPNGEYRHPVTGERYSRKETYAENPGFKEIRRAPVGSIVVIRNQGGDFRLTGKIPAHDEYYEVVQRTTTQKALKLRETSEKNGHYYWGNSVEKGDLDIGGLRGLGHKITTVKEIQKRFPFATQVTIYKPNMPE